MGARGKYRDEVLEDIMNALAFTGKDEDGIKAGGISNNTFYLWLREKPDFVQKVKDAKDRFRKSIWREDPKLKAKAVEGLHRRVDGPTEKWVTSKNIFKISKNGKKELDRVEETNHVVKRPPDMRAVEMVIGDGVQKVEVTIGSESNSDGSMFNDEIEAIRAQSGNPKAQEKLVENLVASLSPKEE